jgi:DNA polymerase V
MGMPYFHIKDMAEKQGITLFSSNFALYRDISARVMHALKDEFPVYEKYSIDESFFEVPSVYTEEDLQSARDRIVQKTGIPVSIGVAETKTRAKLASKQAKQGSGVYVIDDASWVSTYELLPCGSVWGIGRQLSTRLSSEGINTIRDFTSLELRYIRKAYGVVGERLYMELCGTAVYPVGSRTTHVQESYTSTRSFGNVVREKQVLMQALAYHTSVVAERLRADGQVGGRVSILIRGSRFGDFALRESSKATVLPYPTSDTVTLQKEVCALLDVLYDAEIPYKKAGVIVSDIMPAEARPMSLFNTHEDEEKRSVVQGVVDALNGRLGKGKIHSATTLGNGKKWREQRRLSSQAYTTKWTEIPSVKAV